MNRALAAISLVFLVSFLQGSIVVNSSEATYDFGRQITFALDVQSASPITNIVLFVQVSGDDRTEVTPATFAAGSSVTAVVARDVQSQPVPPFSPVTYWWRIEDQSGASLTTPPAIVMYEDDRFEWQRTHSGPITAHWYDGDIAFGQAAADIGASALPKIAGDIGATLPSAVDVYIYNSAAELQAGLTLAGRTWVGGHADPALGVVLVAVAPGPEAGYALERDLPHELTHVLVYQVTQPNYAALPFWLNEGLAAANETVPDPTYRVALEQAHQTDALLPLEALCGGSPLDAAQATLAYAESEAVVRYVRDRRGTSVVRALLAAYADGASCEAGVQRALGLTLAGLQAEWERQAFDTSPVGSAVRDFLPYLPLLLLPLLPLLLLPFAPRGRSPSDKTPLSAERDS